MNLLQITPGAGGMYCGNCFRDNALVAEWRRQGHSTLMVPLYLPLNLDEENQSEDIPIFYGGINVYLEQKSRLFQKIPHWLHRLLASPRLLNLASGSAAKTRPEQVGDLTVSMLRGEEGRQRRELEELIQWLKSREHPDVACLSNGMLIGLARRMKEELNTKVVCMLQGEDYFLDALSEPFRTQAWEEVAQRAKEVDLLIAPSQYYADRMESRLDLPKKSIQIVHNGINLDGFQRSNLPTDPPVLGYFARMCPEKGLDLLVDAYLELRKRRPKLVRLKIGGGMGPSDKPFVERLKIKIRDKGYLEDCSFHPNLNREEKLEFFQSLTLFSVPAMYGEAFGLYLIEAMAAGVPIIQPPVAAFPEIIALSGAGRLSKASAAEDLAEEILRLLESKDELHAHANQARAASLAHYNVDVMAKKLIRHFHELNARSNSIPK